VDHLKNLPLDRFAMLTRYISLLYSEGYNFQKRFPVVHLDHDVKNLFKEIISYVVAWSN